MNAKKNQQSRNYLDEFFAQFFHLVVGEKNTASIVQAFLEHVYAAVVVAKSHFKEVELFELWAATG